MVIKEYFYFVNLAEVTAEELIAYVQEKVSPQKKLRGGVIFVTEIPKLPSGKILRRTLREKYGQP